MRRKSDNRSPNGEKGGDVPDAGAKLRILIADEGTLFRQVLAAALEREPDFEVAQEAPEGATAVAAEQSRADVVILSVGLYVHKSVNESCQIRERVPGCQVIALADSEDQRLLAENLGCGASGYLTKDCSLPELVDAIRAVARGETLIPPTMLGPLLYDLIERRQEHEGALLKLAELSPREREVLGLLARGAKTNAIAEALVISPETARSHIQNILTKLGVHSRLEAAAFVIESGLLDHLNGRSFADALEHVGKER